MVLDGAVVLFVTPNRLGRPANDNHGRQDVVELFVETVRPGIVIFADETNQDLTDFAHAIDLPTRIYRVKKLISDGQVQYG